MTDKVNIASIVSSQFPGFVREDHEAFVAFVKAYYEFLQQDYSTDLKTLRDIDTTLDEYIKHFKSEYASNIPFILANERFVLPNIKDLNLAKGSEASYRLLFRLLFDKEITIAYPGQQMLRASDGRWEQRVSIFVKIVLGTAEAVLENVVEIITSTGSIFTPIHKQVDLGITIDGFPVYEFFIDRKWFGIISIDDRVVWDGTFISHIVPTITKLKITQGGKNFKIGEIYEIGTTRSLLKVVKTDNEGAIINAEIIHFSMDRLYEEGFVYNLVSKTDMQRNLSISDFVVTVPSPNHKHISFNDPTNGTLESFVMNKYDYNIDVDPAGDFFAHNYVGKLLRETYSSNTKENIDLGLLAIIEFNLGSVSKYPGYYTANNGFLDDAMYIQDSKFYQTFSYVIQLDERLDTYKAVVKTLIHPSGVALFGEYTITNDIDLSVGLESMLRVDLLRLKDFFQVPDNQYLHLDKLLNSTHHLSDGATVDNESFSVPDNKYLHLDKLLNSTHHLSDGATVDNESFSVTAPKPVLDFNVKLLNSTHHLFDGTTVDDESFSVTDAKDYFVIDKALSDTPVVTDAKDYFVIDKALSDTPVVTDVKNYSIDKPVSDTLDPVTDASFLGIDKALSDTPVVTAPKPVLDFTKNIEETICESLPGIFSVLGSSVFDAFTDQYTIDPNSDIQIDPGSTLHINSSLWLFASGIDESCMIDETAINTTKLLSDTFVSITENISIGRDRSRSTSDTLDPISDVSFLDIGKSVSDMLDPITADKDYFVIDKVLSDTPVVTDVKNYSIDKPLSDLVTADDTSAINTSKTFEDTLDPVTDANFLNVGKQVSDTLDPIAAEKDHFVIGKALSDTLDPITDAKDHFVVGKALSDTPVVTDAKDHFAIGKALSDTPVVTDAKDHFAIGKALSDTSSITDLITILRSKALSDASSITDAKDHFVIGKVLSDVIYISSFINIDSQEFAADSLNIITDVQNYSFNKPLSDAATVSDVQIFNINKPFADTLDPVSDVSSINTGKAFSNAVFLADSTNIFLNGSALLYKYDTQTVLDSGGALWKNAYLEDMSTFANDGADYMENKIVF